NGCPESGGRRTALQGCPRQSRSCSCGRRAYCPRAASVCVDSLRSLLKNLARPRLLTLRQTRCSIPGDPVLADPKVAECERPTDLLVVVMVFRNNVARPPPPARAPRHPATCACHAAKFQRPRAMCLMGSIAWDRAPLNRNRKAADLCEHVKRNK